jgi:hypothetical protein
MPATGSVLLLSRVLAWDVVHLTDAATHWTCTATVWEDAFSHVSSQMASPGGAPWEGVAAEAVQRRAYADRLKVAGLTDQLHEAAGIARRGADGIEHAKRRVMVIDAVSAAEDAGFTVGEDFAVTSREAGTLAQFATRQARAQAFAAEIRARVGELVAIDQQTAAKVTTATAGVGETSFDASDGNHDPTIQAVDNDTTEPDEGDTDSDVAPDIRVRGLPPEGIDPPVSGPLTEGPASRPSERRVGGRSLWDEHGGEWRYFPGDHWHNPHWDYNPHSTSSGRGSEWDNIPINGLPPRIGDPPPVISALPPWLQGAPSVSGPQNPLLAPFPGAAMPTTPAPVAGVEPGGPHISVPRIDIPAPNAGDLQNAGGPAAVAGAGALLLLILGAMALA